MKTNTECRVCGGMNLRQFLDLGRTPLANSFTKQPFPPHEGRFDLDVHFCLDCTHVQLIKVIPNTDLFVDYIYASGTSPALMRHFAGLADDLVERQQLKPDDLVVEIASNDGILLKEFARHGLSPVGVEPAANLADISRSHGFEVIDAFFSLQSARKIREQLGAARVITGSNVMGHVDELLDFVAGMAHLIDPDGIVSIEVPYLLDLLEGNEFDTIYHEHLSYFSVAVVKRLFASQGLTLVDVTRVPIHGGTIRLFGRLKPRSGEPKPIVEELINAEQRAGLRDLDTFERFAARTEESKANLVSFLQQLKSSNKRIAGYGAAAKGNTLLNYCGIGREYLEYVLDKNPLKQGTYTPGTSLPVYPAEHLHEDPPDYLLILAWNFADEVVEQQKDFLESGGGFIIPAPEFRVIEPVRQGA